VKPGAAVKATLVIENPLLQREKVMVVLEGRSVTADQSFELEVPAGGIRRRELTLKLIDQLPAGRHILTLRGQTTEGPDGSDAFVALDVAP
jgi:hypothetical protein